MSDDLIVTAYVVLDEMMQALGHRSHRLAQIDDAEVLTVAVVAAKYFANNHERALAVMHGMGYLAKPLSASRFNRRLHALGGWLRLGLETLGGLFARGEIFLLVVCRSRSAAAPVPDARASSPVGTSAATARPRRRSSGAPACGSGGCT